MNQLSLTFLAYWEISPPLQSSRPKSKASDSIPKNKQSTKGGRVLACEVYFDDGWVFGSGQDLFLSHHSLSLVESNQLLSVHGLDCNLLSRMSLHGRLEDLCEGAFTQNRTQNEITYANHCLQINRPFSARQTKISSTSDRWAADGFWSVTCQCSIWQVIWQRYLASLEKQKGNKTDHWGTSYLHSLIQAVLHSETLKPFYL